MEKTSLLLLTEKEANFVLEMAMKTNWPGAFVKDGASLMRKLEDFVETMKKQPAPKETQPELPGVERF